MLLDLTLIFDQAYYLNNAKSSLTFRYLFVTKFQNIRIWRLKFKPFVRI